MAKYYRHLHCIGVVFGGRAIELAGRVVEPELQGRNIGSRLLKEFVSQTDVAYLTTYTRNPSILRMMRSVSSSLYPLDEDSQLQLFAGDMAHATYDELEGTVYHFDRYGEEGLFRGFDPAERACETLEPLKTRFKGLMSVRNALVVAASIKGREL